MCGQATCIAGQACNAGACGDVVTQAPVPAPFSRQSKGCWADNKDRIFDYKIKILNLGLDGCEAECLKAGSQFVYMGYEYNSECYCGLEDENYTIVGESTNCVLADGNVGGEWAASVYQIAEVSVAAETPAPVTATVDTPAPVTATVDTPAPVTAPATLTRVGLGCWTDDKNRMFGKSAANDLGLDGCQTACMSAGAQYIYMAYEYNSECFCGTASDDYTAIGASDGCKNGVGGSWTASVYGIQGAGLISETPSPVTAATPAPVNALDRTSLGCWKDTRNRFFSVKLADSLGLGGCQTGCQAKGSQYVYMNYQYQKECYCGTAGDNYEKYGASTNCANGLGGGWSADVYQIGDVETAATPAPVTPSTRVALGCWNDNKARVFDKAMEKNLGLDGCEAACLGAGSEFVYFGYEYNTECYCGVASDDYRMLGASEECINGVGGGWSLDVYQIGDVETPATPAPVTPAGFTRVGLGCWTDDRNRFFDKVMDKNLGLDGCEAACISAGSQYVYMAYEYNSECYCGTTGDNYKVIGESTLCSDGVGGSWSGDVYQIVEIVTAAPVTPAPVMFARIEKGCWSDNEDRVFEKKMANNLGLDGCQRACTEAGTQFVYIMYEYNTECYCGTSEEDYQAVGASSGCKDGVGGNWSGNVYQIRNMRRVRA